MSDIFKWTDTQRQELEVLVQQYSSITKIAEIMNTTRQSILSELKRGLTADYYKDKMYPSYTAEGSVKLQLEKYENKLRGK